MKEYDFHPAADEFPMMSSHRYAELVEDIKKHGQREPITLCDGKVLDGRNRYRACVELGIEPKTRTYDGNPWDLAWSLNGTRRDLVDEQRYLIWKVCNEHGEAWQAERQRIADEANRKRSEAAKEQHAVSNPRVGEKLGDVKASLCQMCGGSHRHGEGCDKQSAMAKHALVVGQSVLLPKTEHDREASKSARAAAARVNKGAVARGDKLAKVRPDLAEKVRKGIIKPAIAHREMQKDDEATKLAEAKATLSTKAAESLSLVCDIRNCSMRELLLSGIKPDCIITDPPYPREFLPVYGELAELAVDVPLVAVMCGQSYMPEIIAAMSAHLKYRWMLAYLTPGGQAVQQWQAKVNTFWKPILLFGEAADSWIGDVCTSKTNDNDKRFHGWGQSETGMADLIERLTKPGCLVCDPFCGGGTTAVASLALGRRFVGCDIDAACVDTSLARCAKVVANA